MLRCVLRTACDCWWCVLGCVATVRPSAVAFSPDGSLIGVGFGGRVGGTVRQKDGAHAILRADTLETVHQVRRASVCVREVALVCLFG